MPHIEPELLADDRDATVLASATWLAGPHSAAHRMSVEAPIPRAPGRPRRPEPIAGLRAAPLAPLWPPQRRAFGAWSVGTRKLGEPEVSREFPGDPPLWPDQSEPSARETPSCRHSSEPASPSAHAAARSVADMAGGRKLLLCGALLLLCVSFAPLGARGSSDSRQPRIVVASTWLPERIPWLGRRRACLYS